MGAMTSEPNMHTFQTPAPVLLRVEIPHGRIQVIAAQTEVTRVELIAINGDEVARQWIAQAEVAQRGDEIVVLVRQHNPKFNVFGRGVEAIVHAPLASGARLSLGSGRIETLGRMGDVEATSGSGAIRLEETGEARALTGSGDIDIGAATGSVDAKSGSGHVTLGAIAGDARVTTGSGHTQIAQCEGTARIKTGSGKVEIDKAGAALDAFSASGAIEVRRADHGRVRAKTVSGRVSVRIADGAAAWLDIDTVSGKLRSSLEQSAPPGEGESRVELAISTVSGDVTLARA
jgi:hypothetical protein